MAMLLADRCRRALILIKRPPRVPGVADSLAERPARHDLFPRCPRPDWRETSDFRGYTVVGRERSCLPSVANDIRADPAARVRVIAKLCRHRLGVARIDVDLHSRGGVDAQMLERQLLCFLGTLGRQGDGFVVDTHPKQHCSLLQERPRPKRLTARVCFVSNRHDAPRSLISTGALEDRGVLPHAREAVCAKPEGRTEHLRIPIPNEAWLSSHGSSPTSVGGRQDKGSKVRIAEFHRLNSGPLSTVRMCESDR
jgi:hypothetical protein